MPKEDFKVYNEVFDNRTIRVLDKFRNEYYEEIEYCISTGKEANVFRAKTRTGHVAVKIFRTYTSSFDNMNKYLTGDPRFTKTSRKKHDIIYLWCRKEFRNLSKSYNAGVLVPKPLTSRENVLVMEFIGTNGVPSPTIKDAEVENYQLLYNNIIIELKKLNKSGLVHADLSEFNILYYKNKPIIIDMAQSVLKEHPKSLEFLKKDIKNINNYFKNKCRILEPEKLFKELNI